MINLPGGYAVTADEYGYILGEPYEDKQGNTILRKKTYHKRMDLVLEEVLARIMRDHVADGTVTTIPGYIQKLQEERTALQMISMPVTLSKP